MARGTSASTAARSSGRHTHRRSRAPLSMSTARVGGASSPTASSSSTPASAEASAKVSGRRKVRASSGRRRDQMSGKGSSASSSSSSSSSSSPAAAAASNLSSSQGNALADLSRLINRLEGFCDFDNAINEGSGVRDSIETRARVVKSAYLACASSRECRAQRAACSKSARGARNRLSHLCRRPPNASVSVRLGVESRVQRPGCARTLCDVESVQLRSKVRARSPG